MNPSELAAAIRARRRRTWTVKAPARARRPVPELRRRPGRRFPLATEACPDARVVARSRRRRRPRTAGGPEEDLGAETIVMNGRTVRNRDRDRSKRHDYRRRHEDEGAGKTKLPDSGPSHCDWPGRDEDSCSEYPRAARHAGRHRRCHSDPGGHPEWSQTWSPTWSPRFSGSRSSCRGGDPTRYGDRRVHRDGHSRQSGAVGRQVPSGRLQESA